MRLLMYPPEQWECDRNRQIEKIQGNDNKFISEKC
ncbi:endonuclease [Gilliamella apis]